jgi:uncharacterized membrane protein
VAVPAEHRVERAEAYAAEVAASGGADAEFLPPGRHVAVGRGWGWIADGYRTFRRQTGIWILLVIVFAALAFGLSRIPVIGWFVSTLLMPVFVGGLMIGCHAQHRGAELELAHLFWGFRRCAAQLMALGLIAVGLMLAALLPAMLLMMATGFVAAVAGEAGHPMAVSAGAMLAFLAMLILLVPVNMALWFAPALVVLQDQSAPRAVALSFRGALKNLVPFLIYAATLFVAGVFASIPFGLGWLVLGPVALASAYAGYRDIFLQH